MFQKKQFIMHSVTNTIFRKLYWDITTRLNSSAASAIASGIQIPNRIERESTDILKALESTVKRDPTAAHYKYHDDPFLIPHSKHQNRTYSLARAAGRRAAVWVREQHPELFQHITADPMIPAFLQKPVYTEKSQVSENILLEVIKTGDVTESLKIYNLLDGKVSVNAKQSLLELLCYYNTEENESHNFLEERWFKKDSKAGNWRNHPILTELFEFLISQGEEVKANAYNSVICGAAKYTQPSLCLKLYKECMDNNIPLGTNAYNAIIKMSRMTTEKNDNVNIIDTITNYLKIMSRNNAQPNRDTLNAALIAAIDIQSMPMYRDFIRSLISEFKTLNIEPSLSSYYYILCGYYKKGNSYPNALLEILSILENKDLSILDHDDVNFFPLAMKIAYRDLHDVNVAQTIHKLLLHGNNYKFIGNNIGEELYYLFYLSVLLESKTLDEFMVDYEYITPHIYIPQESLILDILDALNNNPAETSIKYLPKLWSNIVIFDLLNRLPVVSKALELMVGHCSPPIDSKLRLDFGEAAWIAWENFEFIRAQRTRRMTITGVTVGHICTLLVRAGFFDRMLEIVSYLLKNEGSMIGTFEFKQIDELLNASIKQGHVPGALDILQFAVDGCFEEVSEMTKLIYNSLPLSEFQTNKLFAIVGNEALRSELTSKNSEES